MKKHLDTVLLSKRMLLVQITCMALYGAQLLESDAYYVVYLFLIVASFLCLYINAKSGSVLNSERIYKQTCVLELLFATLFALMVALSNYSIWALSEIPMDYGPLVRFIYSFVLSVIFLSGGFFTFWNIFHYFSLSLEKMIWNRNKGQRLNPVIVFWTTFLVIVSTRWLILHFCLYPGVLTLDSIGQIRQILTGAYSNHHPFYHTQIIRFCLMLGISLFHDVNAGVAIYCFIQILFTAACFSFAVSTMAQMQAPRWMVIVSSLFFICMPYHLVYAITMWKDVPFGCFILLFVLSIYRFSVGFGKPSVNGILLAAACLGTSLFRSNGLFVMILLLIAFFLLWKKRFPMILMIMLSTIILSFVLKHPLLEQLNVTPPDTIESLSIPAQQVSRVVAEQHPLEKWERDTLSKIIDIDEIPDAYQPFISDPIKNLVREKGNQILLQENKRDYIKLYFSLGYKYPGAYIRAWIDQTKGYWNAGYDYWLWSNALIKNEFGITRTIRNTFLNNLLTVYLFLYTEIQALRLFISIGLFVWLDLFMLYIALLRKDLVGTFMTLPVLITVLSLLIATPVFSEFRYIYAAFCIFPTVTAIVFRPIQLIAE